MHWVPTPTTPFTTTPWNQWFNEMFIFSCYRLVTEISERLASNLSMIMQLVRGWRQRATVAWAPGSTYTLCNTYFFTTGGCSSEPLSQAKKSEESKGRVRTYHDISFVSTDLKLFLYLLYQVKLFLFFFLNREEQEFKKEIETSGWRTEFLLSVSWPERTTVAALYLALSPFFLVGFCDFL